MTFCAFKRGLFLHTVDAHGDGTSAMQNSTTQQADMVSASRKTDPRSTRAALQIKQAASRKKSSGKISRQPCKVHLKGTCPNPSCEKWHSPERLFYKTEEGCKFGDKCVIAHFRVEERPSKRSKKNGTKSGETMLFGLCISRHGAAEIFIAFTEELNHAEIYPMCSIH